MADQNASATMVEMEVLRKRLAELEEKVRLSDLQHSVTNPTRSISENTLDMLANAVGNREPEQSFVQTAKPSMGQSLNIPVKAIGTPAISHPHLANSSLASPILMNSPLPATVPSWSSGTFLSTSFLNTHPVPSPKQALQIPFTGRLSISFAPTTPSGDSRQGDKSAGLSAMVDAAEMVESKVVLSSSSSSPRLNGTPRLIAPQDTASASTLSARRPKESRVRVSSIGTMEVATTNGGAPFLRAIKEGTYPPSETVPDEMEPRFISPRRPEAISVVKRKGTVLVTRWGGAPFAAERTIKGQAYIPDGFRVESISDRLVWIGETKVQDGEAWYRFSLKADPLKNGGWHKNASKAYRDAFSSLRQLSEQEVAQLRSSNGRLIIGITYDNLQDRIRQIFPKETALLDASSNFQEQPSNQSAKGKKSKASAGPQTASHEIAFTFPSRDESSHETNAKKPRLLSLTELLQAPETPNTLRATSSNSSTQVLSLGQYPLWSSSAQGDGMPTHPSAFSTSTPVGVSNKGGGPELQINAMDMLARN